MTSPFSFKGTIGRRGYAAGSAGVFLAQHLAAIAVFALMRARLQYDARFWLAPVGTLVRIRGLPLWAIVAAMAAWLLVTWALVALAFRRANDMDRHRDWAGLAIIPAIQIALVVWFSISPGRPSADPIVEPPSRNRKAEALAIAQGAIAGIAIALGAVALGALVFRTYGFVLFLITPFMIGMSTAFIANRHERVGGMRTLWLVMASLGLGGVALVAFALEGVVCLIMAAPLAATMAAIGALFGVELARRGGRSTRSTLRSVAILPLLLAAEAVWPPHVTFETSEHVDVAANAPAVWDAVVHMGPIPAPPAPPFRWGLAYPIRGQIFGQGVGAIRRGVFSTGVAYERVTEWAPDRGLSFVVLSDPPMLREMSPYAHVNAPHVTGYFRTLNASFTLQPLGGGRTRLFLATRHELDLAPGLYWLPFARWAVHENKMRVLRHFADQAEAVGRAARA